MLSKVTKKMAVFEKLLLNPNSLLWLRDIHYFAFIFLTFFCESLKSHENKSETDYLLCKYCGADAADLEYAFTIKSPAAVKIENQTFSGKEVVVQTLKNPSNNYFEVITVKKSNCVGYGEWTKHDSWFPGYAWKICVCQPWGHFLGWVFEPFDLIRKNQKKASEKGFYVLNAENILTEQFSNSLLIVPKTFSRHRDDRRGYRDYRDVERFRGMRRYDGGERYPHSSRTHREQKPY